MDTVELALACYRAPLVYQAWLAPQARLPDDMDRLLWLANGSTDALEAAMRQTGARAEELQEAARFCVQQLCLARDADHYRLLGVNPGAPLEQIKEHHRLLMRLFHPDRAANRESWTDHYAARVNEAWTVLSKSSAAPGAVHHSWQLQPVAAAPAPELKPWLQHAFESPKTRLHRPGEWLPVLVLGGLALAATLALGALYLTTHRAVPAVPASSSSPPWVETAVGPSADPAASHSILSAFSATPDWQALEQREQAVRQQIAQTQAARQQLEQNRQERIAVEESVMQRLRAERMQLEKQLQAEQAQAERAWSERLAAEQKRLEELKAEQVRADQLTAELRAERTRLEALKAEQVRLVQRKPADPAQEEPLRQEARLQAERARLEKARLERLRLEEQLKVEQAKAEQVRLEAERVRAERARRDQAARLEPLQSDQRKKVESAHTESVAAPDRGSVASERSPVEAGLTLSELNELIGRYTRAYERGDVQGILALFAESARSDRDRVRRDYSAFFAKNDIRQLSLRLQWNPQGASASGAGRYTLQAQQRDSGEAQQAEGAIRFKVRKQDGRVLIDAIGYD